MGYIKLTGTSNVHEDWTTEYILEKDENDVPTKVVRFGEPVDLSADERKKLESLGAVFADSSAEENKSFQADRESGLIVGDDVASAGPIFGTPAGQPNQTPGSVTTDSKTTK